MAGTDTSCQEGRHLSSLGRRYGFQAASILPSSLHSEREYSHSREAARGLPLELDGRSVHVEVGDHDAIARPAIDCAINACDIADSAASCSGTMAPVYKVGKSTSSHRATEKSVSFTTLLNGARGHAVLLLSVCGRQVGGHHLGHSCDSSSSSSFWQRWLPGQLLKQL